MLDWSYEYVQKRHARIVVEKLLEKLVRPALTKRDPLPGSFTIKLTSPLPPQGLCDAADELGWYLQLSPKFKNGEFAVIVSLIQPAVDIERPLTDSKWDIEHVRAQKRRFLVVIPVIIKTVERSIGSFNGLPTAFPLQASQDWVDYHGNDLAALGWRATFCGRWYLRGC